MKKAIMIIMAVVMIVVFTPVISFAANNSTSLESPHVHCSAGTKSVKLSWSKVKGAKGYQIYRAASKNGKYKRITTTSKTWVKYKKLKTGKTYFYKVRAYKKSNGKTRHSKFFRLAATPLGVPVCKVNSMVKCNKVRTNGVKYATGYAVYRANSKDGKYKKIGQTKKIYYNDYSAEKGKVYYYRMRAYKVKSGYTTYGPGSEKSRASRLLAAPKTKTSLSPDPNNSKKNQGIKVSWTKVAGAEGYQLFRSKDYGKTYTKIYSGKKRSYIDKKVSSGTVYYYKVRGYRHVYGVLDYGYCSASRHSRDALVNQAKKWIGYSRANGKARKIVKIYNDYKPLPRNMKAGYKEAWCTTFITSASIKANLVDIMPRERICRYLMPMYMELGLWVESDKYVPKKGDLIFYCWKDSGKGDCKKPPKHIGIVVSVSKGKIKTIEGNKNGAVRYNTIKVNGRYIRGFATPKFDVKNGIKFVRKRSSSKNLKAGPDVELYEEPSVVVEETMPSETLESMPSEELVEPEMTETEVTEVETTEEPSSENVDDLEEPEEDIIGLLTRFS